MLTTMTLETTPCESRSTDLLSDDAIKVAIDDFDRTIRGDGKHFNETYLWAMAKELQQQPDIKGDAFTVALAIASLTKVPRYGCRAPHKAIAARASALKKFFAVANLAGWARVFSILNVGA